VSTPADIQIAFRALVSGELLGGAMLREMQRTVDVGDGAHGYGLGLAQATATCGAIYWTHDGDTLGIHTRTGVTGDGARSAVLAISGDADVDAEAGALIDDVICGRL
jgi:D-alanyl-D-alanine carboxypeptidase